MRNVMIGMVLLAAAWTANAQSSIKLAHNFRIGPQAVAPCRGADLSPRHVTDDAAMGGHNLSVYAFKNESLNACTLKGYPVFELLNKSARLLPKGRAINSRKLMGDEAESDPQLVTIEPGKEAVFRVYSNNGGAGYRGKPCPVSRFVSMIAPGTTRTFVLKSEIRSCQAVKVSAVRPSSPE